jgi:hypothetical protein
MPKLVVAQPPLTTLEGELSNALRGVLADDVQPSRMTKEASQRSDRTARNPGAAGRPAASSRNPASCRFAHGDVGLHPLDVPQREPADEASAQQRLDVSLNATSVHLQRRCVDRPATAAENPASFGRLEIPVAHFGDRHASANRKSLGGGIFAPGDAGQLLPGEVTRLLGGQSPILAEDQPSRGHFDIG